MLKLKARVLEKREERASKSGRVGKSKKSESEIRERESDSDRMTERD